MHARRREERARTAKQSTGDWQSRVGDPEMNVSSRQRERGGSLGQLSV